MGADYDVIVIGAGHNGLATAAYLLKAGLSVCVLESYSRVGGGLLTEEVTLPGFKHDLHSVAHSIIRGNPMIANDELGLISRYGLEYIVPDAQIATPFPDGKSIIIYKDFDRTCENIAHVSPEDAKAYAKFKSWGEELFKLMSVFGGRYDPPLEFSIEPEEGLAQVRQLPDIMRRMGSLRRWNPGSLFNLLNMSALDMFDYWFSDPHLKAALAKYAAEWTVRPDRPGTAITSAIALLGNHFIGGGLPKGGASAVPDALKRSVLDQGGKVLTNSEVVRVIVDKSGARGVALKDGTEITAQKAVVSSVNVKQLFQDLISREYLSAEFVSRVRRIKLSEFSEMNIHYAINDAPVYINDNDGEIGKALRVELAPSVDALIQELDDIKAGKLPKHPCPLVCCLSVADPTRAPKGKHTLWILNFAPFNLADGGANKWDEVKVSFGARMLDTVRKYTTNLTDSNLLKGFVNSPLDIVRRDPAFVEGDIMHIELSMSQMFANRPFPGCGQYKTPIKGLYLSGASAHPGGGVTGGGRAAAAGILKDLKIAKSIQEILK